MQMLSFSVSFVYQRDICTRYRFDRHVSTTEQCGRQVNSKSISAPEDSGLLGCHTVSIGETLPTFRKILQPLTLQSRSPVRGITGLLYAEGIMIIRKSGKLPTFQTIHRRFEGFGCHYLWGQAIQRKG